jgi:chromosome segregation protein
MKLESVTLQGFKSFADKTEFDFTHDFTAVVGPNGSGKSNISDAMRWVLGEQSMKLLRSKSQQDLIFGGSSELSRLGMAQVEMKLDNSDGQFPVDYKEVVISRKLFRSGESEYTLNGAKIRLQDIVMMLAQANFGQKSYAVIGQGMITDFLNASPQERKVFFDEATGVREFQIKRDQAINKLIRAEENLVQGEALLKEIEPHLNSLERQVKKLEKRENIEAQLRTIQLQYYGSLWQGLGKEHADLKTAFAAQQTEIQKIEDQIAQLQIKSDAIAGETSRSERYEELQREFNTLLERKSRLLKDQAVLKGKLEIEHQKQGELSLVWILRKEEEITQDLQKHESQIQQLHASIEREQAELERQHKQLAAVQKDVASEEGDLDKLKTQIERETHAMTIPEVQTALRSIFDEHESFVKELLHTESLDSFRSLQSRGKKMLKSFASFMDRLTTEERSAVEVLQIELKRKQDALAQLVQDRNTAQAQVNRLEVNIATTQKEAELHEVQMSRLRGEMQSLHSEKEEAEKGRDENPEDTEAAVQKELKEYDKKVDAIDAEAESIRSRIDVFNKEEEDKKTELVGLQSQMRSLQRTATHTRQEANTIEINIARIETRQEDTRSEIVREVAEDLHDSILNYSSTEEVDRGETEKRMISLQRQLEAIGTIDDATVEEYNETRERFDFLTNQTEDLDKTIHSLDKVIDDLDETIKKQFTRNFKKINDGFQDYFKVLFGGGKAKLNMLTETEEEKEKEDAAQAASEGQETETHSKGEEQARELIGKKKKRQKVVSGIDVMASPPRKKVTNIQSLSGGEKSLVAIALLCSIIANNPAPFVVLDEVEAALDEENSEKLAAILKELSKRTQIVVVTHNRVTMRAADVLYGVTVGTDGKSHILSVKLEEAEEMVEEE